MEETLVLYTELPRYMDVSRQYIHKLNQQGKLPPADDHTFDGKRLWKPETLDEWMLERKCRRLL